MSEISEILEIVNKNNEVIGQASRGEIYKTGALHRAVNVFLFNKFGEMLLQQRVKSKKIYPLFWDLSAAEHVKIGESFEAAAVRGLQEELGIVVSVARVRDLHLQKSEYRVGSEIRREYELVELFRTDYDGEIKMDPSEVAAVKFLSIQDVNRMIAKGESFTPWFLDEWIFYTNNNSTVST